MKTKLTPNTHRADPPLRFPAHRPVLMCQAYRCICIHFHPWEQCHCFCMAGSGRGRSQKGTVLWPCEGRASSLRHTEPPSPALTVASAAETRVDLRESKWRMYLIRWHTKNALSLHFQSLKRLFYFHLLFYDLWKWSNRLCPVWVHFPVLVWIGDLHVLQWCYMFDASSLHVHNHSVLIYPGITYF